MHSFKLFKNHCRQYLKISFFLFSFLILFCLGFNNLYAATYYVCTTGNDNNSGTEAKPFKTLQRAHTAVSAGDTVIVEDGIYPPAGDNVLIITKAGSPGNVITFKARNPHQAILDGNNFTINTCISVRSTAAYIRIEGFTIRRALHTGIRLSSSRGVAAHHIEVINNVIQYIGNVVTTSTNGHSGAFTSPLARHITWKENVFHNCGRLAEESAKAFERAGMSPEHAYRHDHGLYLQGAFHHIENNLFYNNVSGWSIKVDGYLGNDISQSTHLIRNNRFWPETRSDSTSTGHIRFYNNGNCYDDTGCMKNPVQVTIDGNLFYKPGNKYLDSAISITHGSSNSNFKTGTVVKNNITTEAVLWSDPRVADNITESNNTYNADDSMFKTHTAILLTPPSIDLISIEN